jgi:hypothetical protein
VIYVAGLKQLGSRRFPSQLRKLYALCHEYEVTQVVLAAERATTYGLFDATRLEKMLLQEHGARLFAFNRNGSGEGPGSVTPAAAAVEPSTTRQQDEQEGDKDTPEGEPNGGDNNRGA